MSILPPLRTASICRSATLLISVRLRAASGGGVAEAEQFIDDLLFLRLRDGLQLPPAGCTLLVNAQFFEGWRTRKTRFHNGTAFFPALWSPTTGTYRLRQLVKFIGKLFLGCDPHFPLLNSSPNT
jgi:hypothetical protein